MLYGCRIYIEECSVKGLYCGSWEQRTVGCIVFRDCFVIMGSEGLLFRLCREMQDMSLEWD